MELFIPTVAEIANQTSTGVVNILYTINPIFPA